MGVKGDLRRLQNNMEGGTKEGGRDGGKGGGGGGGDRAEEAAGPKDDSEDVLGSDRLWQRVTRASSKTNIAQSRIESGKPLCLFC